MLSILDINNLGNTGMSMHNWLSVTDRGKLKYSENDLSHWQFVHKSPT
jgi:hypothetical protein